MADLTEQQARVLIASWCRHFNTATRGNVRAVEEAVPTEDDESSTGRMLGPRAVNPGSRISRPPSRI
jgi:hypothetical protein